MIDHISVAVRDLHTVSYTHLDVYKRQEKWSMGSAPFVAEEVNGVWTRAVEVRGMSKLNVGNYAWVQSASCGDADNCCLLYTSRCV